MNISIYASNIDKNVELLQKYLHKFTPPRGANINGLKNETR